MLEISAALAWPAAEALDDPVDQLSIGLGQTRQLVYGPGPVDPHLSRCDQHPGFDLECVSDSLQYIQGGVAAAVLDAAQRAIRDADLST